MGVATRAVTPIIIKLPTMALANPPPSEPGAGVDSVKTAQLKPAKPFLNKMIKIQISATRPKTIEAMDKIRPR
jgi:hypothetical protein